MIPGAGIAASDGGLPPWTAVERSCVRFVDGRYLTVTFGFLDLKPARTALNDSPSGPVQSARMVTVPETFAAPPVVPSSSLSPPPQPTAASATTAPSSSVRTFGR